MLAFSLLHSFPELWLVTTIMSSSVVAAEPVEPTTHVVPAVALATFTKPESTNSSSPPSQEEVLPPGTVDLNLPLKNNPEKSQVIRGVHYGSLYVSTNADTADAATLRRRFLHDGYIYMRNVLPPSFFEPFRGLFTDTNMRANVGRHGGTITRVHTLEETAANPDRNLPFAPYQAAAMRVPYDPNLVRLIDALCPSEHTMHDSHIYFRIKRPSEFTVIHADWSFFGKEQDMEHQTLPPTSAGGLFFTVWIPLTPCTPQTTGLLLVPRSHVDYVHSHNTLTPPSFDAPAVASAKWAGASFAVGDVVVFDACTIHAAGEKKYTKKNKIKLHNRYSIDFRVVPKSFRLKPAD